MTQKELIELILQEDDFTQTRRYTERYPNGNLIDPHLLQGEVGNLGHKIIHQYFMIARRGNTVASEGEAIIPIVLNLLINPPASMVPPYPPYLPGELPIEDPDSILRGWMDACIYLYPDKASELIREEIHSNRHSWTTILNWLSLSPHLIGSIWMEEILALSEAGAQLDEEQKRLITEVEQELRLSATPIGRKCYAGEMYNCLCTVGEKPHQ